MNACDFCCFFFAETCAMGAGIYQLLLFADCLLYVKLHSNLFTLKLV